MEAVLFCQVELSSSSVEVLYADIAPPLVALLLAKVVCLIGQQIHHVSDTFVSQSMVQSVSNKATDITDAQNCMWTSNALSL
jgi:xanthosine utilization system XapX-like protein